MINKYSKVFFGELAFSATDFCNGIKYFWAAENLTNAQKQIGKKHFVGVSNVTLPLPTKHDPKHNVTISLISQNDLKRNRGFQLAKLTDQYNLRPDLQMKNEA